MKGLIRTYSSYYSAPFLCSLADMAHQTAQSATYGLATEYRTIRLVTKGEGGPRHTQLVLYDSYFSESDHTRLYRSAV